MHHADTPMAHDIRVFFQTGELDGERGAWFFASRRDHVEHIRGGKPHCANTKLKDGFVFIPARRMPTIIESGCSMQPDLREAPDSEAAVWQRRHYQAGARALGIEPSLAEHDRATLASSNTVDWLQRFRL